MNKKLDAILSALDPKNSATSKWDSYSYVYNDSNTKNE